MSNSEQTNAVQTTFRPAFEPSAAVKVMFNIGALLDIPTGTYLRGLHGEHILNGGLATLTGIAGIGNNFKSALMHYMSLSALSRVIWVSKNSGIDTYDTEINVILDNLINFARRFSAFKGRDLVFEGVWRVTDKTIYYANEWFEILKKFLKEKKADAKKYMVTTPFPDRDRVTAFKMPFPSFGQLDSFSEFETEDVAEIYNKNELGEAGGNTVHMRSGLAKTRFLMEVPALCGGGYHYMTMVAQLGKKIEMASGPMPVAPTKTLQYLKNGDTLKGVTGKFSFLMNNCWHAFNAAPVINQGTKGPEYPREGDSDEGGTDLNIVSLRQLRGKSGPTGIVIQILVSQIEGVLAELTEFHYIKENDRFGISGTMQHYSLDLLPDVKLQRTTVRSKLDNDPKLCRAVNITSELCQMHQYWRHLTRGYLPTPKELYDGLKAKGYDWDVLLATRGWWTFDNDKHEVPFLSTMDLVAMLKGDKDTGEIYHPYWMNADKTVKVRK